MPLKELRDTGASFGGWIGIPNPVTAELFGASAFRWSCFDMQHGAVEESDLLGLIQAMSVGGAASIVRVGWNDPRIIMRVLDLGASGVIVPMIESADDARAMSSALHYPPRGGRSFGPVRKGLVSESSPVFGLAMIETASGMAALDEIAEVEDLDGFFIGPVDLALSMGLTLKDVMDGHPDLEAAYGQIAAAAARNGKIVGSICIAEGQAERFLDIGINLLALNSDRGYVTRGLAADAARLDGLRKRVLLQKGGHA